jgi:nitrogen fixation/metabolism regulation signal transduction histidine kinase
MSDGAGPRTNAQATAQTAAKAVPTASRGARAALATAAGMSLALALVLLILLTSVTRNAAQFDRYFSVLLWVNVGVAAVLLALVVGFALRLVKRLRARHFGSRLIAKIAAIFVLIGAAPGLLIYLVSYQFVARSIESWFDVKVEAALEAGLSLGRATLDEMLADLQAKARSAAAQWADAEAGGQPPGPVQLDRLRERLGASDVLLFNAAGQVLGSAGSRIALVPELPPPAQLRNLRTTRGLAQIEPLGDDGAGGPASAAPTRLRLRVVVPLPSASVTSLGAEARFLQALRPVPESVARNALDVQDAYREYQERSLARQGLKRLYIGTLTLALWLAVFTALLMAIVLGDQLARPLLILAEGVKSVAGGDLSPRAELPTRDELGDLIRDFNSMTRQLAEARQLADTRRNESETARAYLQTLLDNMSAGVVVFDREQRLRLSNPNAEALLQRPLPVGLPLADAASPSVVQAISDGFAQLEADLADGSASDHFTRQLERKPGDSVTLLLRGAFLQLPEARQHIVVFDDISELLAAQRAAAWAEVARRVAHEIKNPLTPIQLSAERLKRKLDGQLTSDEARAVLDKAVTTIVNQVDAMKRMVNDFRDYARLPPAELAPIDLNALVDDVLHLYAGDEPRGHIQRHLAADLPRIAGDATQLRQVIHNLLQNAGDAVAGRADALVQIRTESSLSADGIRRVRLVVSDNGPGFAEPILRRAFEPYVTTKTRGTGLGLAIVKKIVDEHGARIDLRNLEASDADTGAARGPAGAQVSITFALGRSPGSRGSS